jgi:protein SCO1/2
MASPSTGASQPDESSRILDRGFWLVLVMGVVCIAFVVAAMAGSLTSSSSGAVTTKSRPSSSPSPSWPVDLASYLLQATRAPRLELTDQDGRPYSLRTAGDANTFVFFGYSHCEDVCPATMGTIGEAMTPLGSKARAVFVTVDPERDTTTWLHEFARYMPAGFSAVTGTASEIAATAAGWGVTYAREDIAANGSYGMSHTTDVYLVDAAGMLRARFPYGTEADVMTAVAREVSATPTASPSATETTRLATATATSGPPTTPTPSATTVPEADTPLGVEVVSTSIWSGPPGPIILALSVNGVRLADTNLRPTVQLASMAGAPFGPTVTASAVQPPGVKDVSYVAMLPVDKPGAWRLVVTADRGGHPLRGDAVVTVKDPGATAPLGGAAPTAHTPTLADAGGIARAVTTDPAPDLRLSTRSTTDALADHTPFVLVVDSVRFRVSPACGRAVVMARYLRDRWTSVDFIHLEPYRYAVVTDTAVLDGSIGAPTLTDPAAAWGVGADPWGPLSMPWIFVVDGNGVVRAKYQGVVGTEDVDVVVSLIESGG